MQFDEIRETLRLVEQAGHLNTYDLEELENPLLWQDLSGAYTGELSAEIIMGCFQAIHEKGITPASWRNFLSAWFRNLGIRQQTKKEPYQTNYQCNLCLGSPQTREQHIKELTRDIYTEMDNGEDVSWRSIPDTLEKVYQHAGTTFNNDPQIRLWAKVMIAQIEGWTTRPLREQTVEERVDSWRNAASRGWDKGVYRGPQSDSV